jgi:hypothetical protein
MPSVRGVSVGFDRADDGEDMAAAGHPVRAVSRPEHDSEIHDRSGEGANNAGRERNAADGQIRDAGKETGGRQIPTPEERIAAYHRARETADAVYAAWDRLTASQDGEATPPGRRSAEDGDHRKPEADEQSRGHRGGDAKADGESPTRSPDEPALTEEALRRRVSELEADKAASDKRLAEQDARLEGQDKRITLLEADLGRVAAILSELRTERAETEAAPGTRDRFRGGEAEREEAKEQQKPRRRVPTDAVNNTVAVAVGSAITALPYQVPDFPPEVAGLAAGGVALGAGIIAVWRERRKAKDDADHRPGN